MNNKTARILIVDDEKEICQSLAYIVASEGFTPEEAFDGETAMKKIHLNPPDVLLVDVQMPGMTGLEVLQQVKELDLDIPIILITAYANVHESVEAMRQGAHDYLSKPFDIHEVARVVRRALTERELKLNLRNLSAQLKGKNDLLELMGPSDKIRRLVADVNRVAQSDFTVVITGETGSGKELIAQAIHSASPRAGKPFVPVDCGAIPETLIESELFGYEKGAFTGANHQKAGKFEISRGGTVFLDEISNMPFVSQAKLLRALQEKKITRIGATQPLNTDIRLVVATNQSLHNLAQNGVFRSDLFYRLNEFSINVPPLRERGEDIPYLAKRFLDMANVELNKCISGFNAAAMESLLNYNWPGNVRQLRSVIRQAALLAKEMITEDNLRLQGVSTPGFDFMPKIQEAPWKNASLAEIVQQCSVAIEREVLLNVLKYTGGNKAKAARLLHIDYKTIHNKIKKFGFVTSGGNNA